MRVDAVDESALVGPGVDHAVAAGGQAEDVFLPSRVKHIRLAFRAEAVDFAVRPRTGVNRLIFRIDCQRPDIGLAGLRERTDLSARVDAEDLSVRPGPGINAAVGRGGQAQHLALLAGMDDDRPALGGHLVYLALIARRHIEVAGAILNHVPHMGGVQTRQRAQLPR